MATSSLQILQFAVDEFLLYRMSSSRRSTDQQHSASRKPKPLAPDSSSTSKMSHEPSADTPSSSPSTSPPPPPPTQDESDAPDVPAAPAAPAAPIAPIPVAFAGRQMMSPMPFPGAPGAPYFSGSNVTEFLQRFEMMSNEYGLTQDEMFKKLPWYCERTIGDYIKATPEYTLRDGAGLFRVIRKDYRKHDYDQQVNSRNFLETLKAKPRTEKDNLKQYCRQFYTISHHLVERRQLEAYTRAMWFIQGLPLKVREKVVRKVGCDPDDRQWTTIRFLVPHRRSLMQNISWTDSLSARRRWMI